MKKKFPKAAATTAAKTAIIAAGLIALLALLLSSIPAPNNSVGNATGNATIGTSLSGLHFESGAEGGRIKALDSCIADFARGWKSVGYEEIGNFYEKRWCTGNGSAPDCQISEGNQYSPDQHAIEFYTLHYDDQQTYLGEGLNAISVQVEKGWGASFSFGENGGTIAGDGFGLGFNYFDFNESGQPIYNVHFGDSNSYSVYENSVGYASSLPMRDDLQGYLASPESMRDKALAQMDALDQNVQEYLNSSSAWRCEYGPYLGHGIPPVCNKRALNGSERAEQAKAAQEYFSGQEKLLNGNYREMYNGLMGAFPFGECWK